MDRWPEVIDAIEQTLAGSNFKPLKSCQSDGDCALTPKENTFLRVKIGKIFFNKFPINLRSETDDPLYI